MYCNNPYNYFLMNARQQYPFMPGMQQGSSAGVSQNPVGPMPTQQPMQQMPMQQMPMQQMPMQQMPMQQMPMQQFPAQTQPAMQAPAAAPVDLDLLQQEIPVMGIDYTQGYLRTQIGRRVKVEFLIGTGMLVDREGILTDVGISYIIINETETDDLLLCDIYSIKFVTFFY